MSHQSEGDALPPPPLHSTACGAAGEECDTQTEGQSQECSLPHDQDVSRGDCVRHRRSGGTRFHLGTSGTFRSESLEPVISEMQDRMAQMENVLQQVLHHLSPKES